MNANQIINMVLRMFVRKAINKGMNSGLNKLSGGRQSGPHRQNPNLKQARRATKMARRVGRL